MFFFFYFNLIFGYKLVILIYFFFVHGEIKLTYLLTCNGNTKQAYRICSELTMNTAERCH